MRIIDWSSDVCASDRVADHCPPGTDPEQWNVEGLKEAVGDILNLEPDIDAWMEEDALDPELIETRLAELADQAVAEKAASLDPASWHMVEKNILLQSLYHHWKEHLATLYALRQVVHLRAYENGRAAGGERGGHEGES